MLHYNITFIKDSLNKNISDVALFTKTLIHSKRLFLLCALALFCAPSLHAENMATASKAAPIVVSIKPLFSLVSHLTQGIEAPVLLMKQPQSPHHYSIRPSERRLLAKAKMIVWLGPEFETSLQKIIKQSSATAVSALRAEDLQLLKRRTRREHTTKHKAHGDENHHQYDPHVWLSTHNAIAISKHINNQLIKNNPDNTKTYQENLKTLIAKIKQTDDLVKSILQKNNKSFIAYHDAFQYFENENALNFIAAISTDDETSTSLKHLGEIKQQIKQHNTHCLVYQPPKSAIAETLSKQHNMHLTMLDILGTTITNDEDAWFEILALLANNFNQCLTAR